MGVLRKRGKRRNKPRALDGDGNFPLGGKVKAMSMYEGKLQVSWSVVIWATKESFRVKMLLYASMCGTAGTG